MKKTIIFCDGGLGNRLGALIGGLLVSKELNREPIICWPENTWCGCSFDDLFYSQYELIDLDINTLFFQNINNKFLIHENQTKLSITHYYPDKNNIESFKNIQDDTIVYYHNSVPDLYSEEQIISVLSSFKIKESIKDKVDEFCIKNNINKNVLGIHFRKTDFQTFLDEDKAFNHISLNPQTNFFICSDSLETEKKFSILNNIIVYPKNSYVTKLIEGSWNNLTTDNEGRQMNFNVNRSKESVIEGFIDLLILSKTNIIVNSHSSFLKFAKLYNKINL